MDNLILKYIVLRLDSKCNPHFNINHLPQVLQRLRIQIRGINDSRNKDRDYSGVQNIQVEDESILEYVSAPTQLLTRLCAGNISHEENNFSLYFKFLSMT